MSATTRTPQLPPVYRATAVAAVRDPFAEAQRMARAGASAGTFVWSQRTDRIAFAVILEPEYPRARSLSAIFAAMLALGDALGGVIPPVVAVTFRWPDRIDVNGGFAGGMRAAMAETDAPDAVPPWMVVAASVASTGRAEEDSQSGPGSEPETGPKPGDEPGDEPGRTTLFDEGCGFVDPLKVMGRFGQYFMYWVNRWRDEGMAPVTENWLARESGFGEETTVHCAGRTIAGRLVDLDDTGGAVLDTESGRRNFALDAALRTPSWSLDDEPGG